MAFSPAEKRRTYRRLHGSGCFVLPAPWDAGTSRYIQHLGFRALAPASAGFAFAQGIADSICSVVDSVLHAEISGFVRNESPKQPKP